VCGTTWTVGTAANYAVLARRDRARYITTVRHPSGAA